MFGKNNKSPDVIEKLKKKVWLDDRLFSQLERDKEAFMAGAEEIDNSYRQVEENVSQARENMKSAASLAEDNAKVEAELLHSIGDCARNLSRMEEWQGALCRDIRDLAKEAERLVEENKHFTSPSKYLSDFPAGLKNQNRVYMESLNEMLDFGKQMGVLALNAAIEAGRMGDPGREFVTAAENIRSYASNYDKAVRSLQTKVQMSEQKIEDLEEQVRRLVKLLKENNVSTARLMKSCDALAGRAEKERPAGLADMLTPLRNQVTILKNADEEIIKSQERNRMQMDDLKEEFAVQQKSRAEMYKLMDPVFRHAVERRNLD